MKFIADIHVHSKYSRATAKNLDLEHLYIAAQRKGIQLVATGDATHPAWFDEISEKLAPDGSGFFALKPDIARACDGEVPPACQGPVRFILETEISNIYKKNERTRKNHNLIYLPDIETAARLNAKLETIGNIRSDGRPILGLDARELLAILLDISDQSFLIPAHIWTPWFSLLGSKSGFDSLNDCFEDLSAEVFAAETGLSSDAPMNWRVSELDQCTLVSNSDAHSPANLGRNANILDSEFSFVGLRNALKSRDPARCRGTLDMYPQEGKYHMDGHRKCGVCLHPRETMAKGGICPVCGKPLTIGVLYRAEELADRPPGYQPENAPGYSYIIPLPEILSELLGVGPKTKKVNTVYERLLAALGPELGILLESPLAEIEKAGGPLLAEAISRMRAETVHIAPGYDGEYGRITLFDPAERERLVGQGSLFAMPAAPKGQAPKSGPRDFPKPAEKQENNPSPIKEQVKEQIKDPVKAGGKAREASEKNGLNDPQRQAVEHASGPLLIVAGPGAGKTRTLTWRIAHLMAHRQVPPESILAITFTQKAAQEMRQRLRELVEASKMPTVATFHALCLAVLNEEEARGGSGGGVSRGGGGSLGGGVTPPYRVVDAEEAEWLVAEAIKQSQARTGEIILKPGRMAEWIRQAKQELRACEADLRPIAGEEAPVLARVYAAYQKLLARERRYDYEDLIYQMVKKLEGEPRFREKYQRRFAHILVDEYQDLNAAQYRILRALAPPEKELCAIGDPDQAIYGFRGSDIRFFQQFTRDYPSARVIRLEQNYRSAEPILQAAGQMMGSHSLHPEGTRVYSGIPGIPTVTVLRVPTERAEGVAIGRRIEEMVGGTGFYSVDFGKTDESGETGDRAFSDFAVLCRTHQLAQGIAAVLEGAGIPCQLASRKAFWDGKGIQELLALFRLLRDPAGLCDLQRIATLPGIGPGKPAMERFKNACHQGELSMAQALSVLSQGETLPGVDKRTFYRFKDFLYQLRQLDAQMPGGGIRGKLDFLVKAAGLRSIIPRTPEADTALHRLFELAYGFGDDINGFLRTLALQTDPDLYAPRAQKVAVMTLHAAKGLEFPVVFVAGCEHGFLPFVRSPEEAPDMEEERRLFFVAMTRAKEQLFLSHADKRTVYGKTVKRAISPFVSAIEEDLLSRIKANPPKSPQKKGARQMDLFD